MSISKIVRFGFEDVLLFRVGAYSKSEMKELLEAMGPIEYNAFSGVEVAGELDRMIGSRMISVLWFGRELSPVIYIEPHEQKFSKAIAKAMESLNADEVDIEKDWKGTVRAWWD